jgi:hypothetical protein
MPSKEQFEFRVSAPKLLAGLLLSVIPISVAGLFSISQTHKSLEKTIGNHFKSMAESTAAATSQFIRDRVVDVGLIAVEPAIVDAVAASNRSFQGMPDAAITAKFQKLDNSWNTPAAETMVKEMLSTPASRLVRRQHERDPRILRVTVTDARGATVAASHKTLDYYQADEEYWQDIYAQGRGAISLTDILYDEATKTNYIGIGVPVTEESSTRFIGTLDALVDVSSVFPIINRMQIGQTGRMMLVKEDGTVISAPQGNLAMKLKSDEYFAVKDELSTLQGRQIGYTVADIRGSGQNLIGFADTELKRDFRRLGWTVLACQNTSEAFAPARIAERLIAFMSVIGLAAVTMIAVWFALHRRRPLTEIGELRREVPAESRGGAGR